jgi:hypothetical protein
VAREGEKAGEGRGKRWKKRAWGRDGEDGRERDEREGERRE